MSTPNRWQLKSHMNPVTLVFALTPLIVIDHLDNRSRCDDFGEKRSDPDYKE